VLISLCAFVPVEFSEQLVSFLFIQKFSILITIYILVIVTRDIASLSTAVIYYLFNVNATYEIYSNYGVMPSAVIFH